MSERSSATTEFEVNVLIEGWRGLVHSYCLVNQYQILELLRIPRVSLFHHDAPYASHQWNRNTNSANFSADLQALIDAVPSSTGVPIDCVYRISFPFVSGLKTDLRRTVTFMATELGLTSHCFGVCAGSSEAVDLSFFTREDNIIVTPSKWSRDRIVDYGFPRNKIVIVPHAVDRNIFYPIERSERLASRAKLGIGVDEVVFLNIGAAVWTKGADILVRAFAAVRDGGGKVRLLFKDQKGLYGSKIENVIREASNTCPELLKSEVIGAISVISENLSGSSLCELYNIADCYVSPYRAEGFNLPVLEAIACGLPVIVTKGGATDDFCSDHFAIQISGEIRELAQEFPDRNGTYIEPRLDELIKAMSDFASGKRHDEDKFSTARLEILNRFSWPNAACQLASLLTKEALI